MNIKHTFVICAYKESPYLEECILSIKQQTLKSVVIAITSTPNSYIKLMCEKYRIPLFVNEGESGIVQDWNFAYSRSNTPYVTIAHQDDIYFRNYTEEALTRISHSKCPLIFFSDYYEIREGKYVLSNLLLRIKRIMLFPLRIRSLQHSIFIRRRILSLGSPICCPSVMYVKENLPRNIFKIGFRSNEDWEAWEMISKYKGDFLYDSKPLMAHRIHRESETSSIIAENKRSDEDFIMFSKFWPKHIAKVFSFLYAKSQKSNTL